jgi:hypothetical protein
LAPAASIRHPGSPTSTPPDQPERHSRHPSNAWTHAAQTHKPRTPSSTPTSGPSCHHNLRNPGSRPRPQALTCLVASHEGSSAHAQTLTSIPDPRLGCETGDHGLVYAGFRGEAEPGPLGVPSAIRVHVGAYVPSSSPI